MEKAISARKLKVGDSLQDGPIAELIFLRPCESTQQSAASKKRNSSFAAAATKIRHLSGMDRL